jgi:hypothetical protein
VRFFASLKNDANEMDNEGQQHNTKATKENKRGLCLIWIFHDMPPNVGDAMYDVQLYDFVRSTRARSQAPGALHTTHTLLKPNAYQSVSAHVRKMLEFTDGA